MTVTPSKLAQAALTTSAQTLYTTPETVTAVEITRLLIANTTASSVTVTVNAGGLTILPRSSLAPNTLAALAVCHIMSPGDSLEAFASADGVNLFVPGVIFS